MFVVHVIVAVVGVSDATATLEIVGAVPDGAPAGADPTVMLRGRVAVCTVEDESFACTVML
jgi:hypothetical protein